MQSSRISASGLSPVGGQADGNARIDWSTLRRIEGTFVDEALRDRITDLLFEVELHGAPLLLHTVVDHKSSDDWATALQVVRYVVRIHDRWLAEHPGAKSLPPILAFVVHHGERPWRAARSADELVDLRGCKPEVAAFLRPLQLRMPFLLLDLAGMDEAAIDGMRLSIVSSLTLRFLQVLRSQPPEAAVEHIVQWQRLVARLLEHRRGKDVLMALFSWFLGAPASEQCRLLMQSSSRSRTCPPCRRSRNGCCASSASSRCSTGRRLRRHYRPRAASGVRRARDEALFPDAPSGGRPVA